MTFADEVTADSPLLWWDTRQASGSVQPDRSGNSHAGTVHGSPVLSSDGLTLDNTATGDDQFITSDATLTITAATFAFETVYSQHLYAGDALLTLDNVAEDQYTGYLPINFPAGAPGLQWWDGSTRVAFDSNSLPLDTYRHVLFEYDGTNAIAYVDGTAVYTHAVASPGLAVAALTAVLGNDLCACGDGFNGLVRHGIIYTHSLGPTRAAAHAAAALADDDPGPAAMTATTVTLNSLLMDNTTVDGDGISYGWELLDGWFDTTDVRVEIVERQPMGGAVSVARRNARQLSLSLFAFKQSGSLDDLYNTAIRTVKRALDLASAPGLLVVAEPGLTLQAYVRAAGPIRSQMVGERAVAEFLVPLVAPDPRRYHSTLTTDTTLALTGSGTTVTQTLVNNGDVPTPPVITIDGPATHPMVVNNTAFLNPSVRYNGTLGGGDTLVIDMANLTAKVNGTSVLADLESSISGPPSWWQLLPGNNSITYSRTGGSGTSTAQTEYRDAYS